MDQASLQALLYLESDRKNAEFSNKLKINDTYKILGLKVPVMRQIAKDIEKREGINHIYDFLSYTDPLYYEQLIITYFIFARISKNLEFNKMIELLDKLLIYNNSWATNDFLASAMKIKKEINTPYFNYLCEKSKSKNPWDIRFATISLMSNYLDDAHIDKCLKLFSQIESDEYYVEMAVGWAFATALAKQRDKTYSYLFEKKIKKSINKIAIQKSIESRRISPEDKRQLKELRNELKSIN